MRKGSGGCSTESVICGTPIASLGERLGGGRKANENEEVAQEEGGLYTFDRAH